MHTLVELFETDLSVDVTNEQKDNIVFEFFYRSNNYLSEPSLYTAIVRVYVDNKIGDNYWRPVMGAFRYAKQCYV
jgi:hypothetical protein